jgi:hypothetical protein
MIRVRNITSFFRTEFSDIPTVGERLMVASVAAIFTVSQSLILIHILLGKLKVIG